MKKVLATILALVMALGLTTMAWAEGRVALSTLTEAGDAHLMPTVLTLRILTMTRRSVRTAR